MPDASNVSTGKPATAGAIFVADYGATLPTTASATLSDDFQELGYVSEDGLTNSNSPETASVKEWGGLTVMTTTTSKEDKFTYTLIESLNENVLAFVYGSDNVSGTLSTGITVTANGDEAEDKSIVIDQIMRNSAIKRIVIPCGSITEVADIVYGGTNAVGYQTTVTCTPDSSGNTHYEYILQSA